MKRTSYKIKEQILSLVKEQPYKYTELQRKIGTNYNSVKAHCEDLEDSEEVSVEYIPSDPANGRPAYKVQITERGIKTLENKKKRKKKQMPNT